MIDTVMDAKRNLDGLREDMLRYVNQESRGQHLTVTERKEFEELTRERIPEAKRKLEELSEGDDQPEGFTGLLDGRGGSTLQRHVDRDATDEPFETPVRTVRSDESVADYLRSNERQTSTGDDLVERGLNLGSICRALICGPSNDLEQRAMAEGTDTAGGYSVPTVLSGRIIDNLRAKSVVVRAGASTIALDSDKHDFAKLTGDPVAGWRNESAPVSESDPTLGRVRFEPKSLATVVRASRELLEDARGLDSALRRAFALSFANKLDQAALYGTGTAPEPRGVKNVSGIGSIDMGGVPIDYLKLVEAWQKLAEANAPGGPTAFVMAPRTRARMAMLRDSSNQPLAKPDLIANIPMLDTTSIPVDETAGASTDASTILAGYWPDLVLGIRSRFRIIALNERYMDNNEIGFVGMLRADVQVWNPESFCEIKGVTN